MENFKEYVSRTRLSPEEICERANEVKRKFFDIFEKIQKKSNNFTDVEVITTPEYAMKVANVMGIAPTQRGDIILGYNFIPIIYTRMPGQSFNIARYSRYIKDPFQLAMASILGLIVGNKKKERGQTTYEKDPKNNLKLNTIYGSTSVIDMPRELRINEIKRIYDKLVSDPRAEKYLSVVKDRLEKEKKLKNAQTMLGVTNDEMEQYRDILRGNSNA